LTAACTSSVDRPRSPANLAAIAIYQSPGANAVATLQAVRARLAELEKRFPEDVAWKVTYDRTTFVTATIEEVEKTLIEAFVLVSSNFAILERYFHIEQREGDRIHLGLTDHGRKVGA
jgi:multidrug efflux pump subunit AcrB